MSVADSSFTFFNSLKLKNAALAVLMNADRKQDVMLMRSSREDEPE